MGLTTAINWADATWNPLTGCTRVTEGCDNCFAFALHDMRHHAYLAGKDVKAPQYHKPFSEIQLLPSRLEQPLHVRRPTKFFVNSMSDLFHSQVPDDYIFQVFDIMRQAHWHTFQILTKRIGRLRRLGQHIQWSPNIWMGVIEQDSLTPRANALRDVPAAVRFLSCEPLLGPLPSLDLEGIHWVITGGESGPNFRPCQPEWVRDIRDQCVENGVAFWHKQWAGRTPKVGGRELDGRTWDEVPQ